MPSHLISRKEVAALLGVSERTISRWDAEGRFSRVQLTERTVRYFREQIETWVSVSNTDPARPRSFLKAASIREADSSKAISQSKKTSDPGKSGK